MFIGTFPSTTTHRSRTVALRRARATGQLSPFCQRDCVSLWWFGTCLMVASNLNHRQESAQPWIVTDPALLCASVLPCFPTDTPTG